MKTSSKAHTATANRIAALLGTDFNREDGPDIVTDEVVVEVETSATLADGVKRLKRLEPPVYVAVTNKESIPEALRMTDHSHIGVMDPMGAIVRPSPPHTLATDLRVR